MNVLIPILILSAFLQTSIWPINLVLMIILIRTYIRSGPENLYLAFGLGLLLSFLEHSPLGLFSLIFILLTSLTHLLSRSSFSKNFLTVVPVIIIMLIFGDYLISLVRHISWQLWPKILIETILILPFYFVIKLWEERFVVRRDVKLKV